MFMKVATLLDPRHKRLKCIKLSLREGGVAHLKTLVKLELQKSENDDEEAESVHPGWFSGKGIW